MVTKNSSRSYMATGAEIKEFVEGWKLLNWYTLDYGEVRLFDEITDDVLVEDSKLYDVRKFDSIVTEDSPDLSYGDSCITFETAFKDWREKRDCGRSISLTSGVSERLVYKIFDKNTGLYKNAGTHKYRGWSKTGKVWRSVGALKNALNLYREAPTRYKLSDFPKNWVIEQYELKKIGERTVEELFRE